VIGIAVLAAAWLFVSDIHLDPTATAPPAARSGSDTNVPLLQSALAEMRRVDPNPPVVVIGGDLVAHHIETAKVVPTIASLATTFGRAFPHAQFVIALGNNDSPCGDYGISRDSPFLRAVAQAWEPLVDRGGAAPAFARTFAHDGFYVARLPLPNTTAVVVSDTDWSPRAHACVRGNEAANATAADLTRALAARPGERHWILMHIPPGIDAFSTVQLVHRLAVVPLLDPGHRTQFERTVAAPGNAVVLVVAAHIHRFAYRILGAHGPRPVPLLSIPSISPVYGNAPAFLTVDVAGDGTVENAEEHAFVGGAWVDAGGTRTLGLRAFTAPGLAALQTRLADDRSLRRAFARLYSGHEHSEINAGNWRAYWCAATELGIAPFKRCLGAGGYRIVTQRGLIVLGVVLVLFVAALVALIAVIRRRGQGAQPAPP
jgi:sphingomyelin phosphodiesterase acid-like 3